ncbi:pseudouridine synthase [Persephonella sp.]
MEIRKIRLDKFLADFGLGSRKEVKKLIKRGYVSVNNQILTDPSIHVDPEKDQIIFNDQIISYKKHHYYMFNKPSGYITAVSDEIYPTVMEFFYELPFSKKLFPIGRLDIDTEGLLIITDDGQFAHRVAHPKWNIEKEYYAVVKEDVSQLNLKKYEKEGILLRKDRYRTKPFKIEVISSSNDKSEILIIVTEGKYHIVKKIMEELGHPVLYLKRVRIGSLRLDKDLETGEFRELTDEEIKNLKRLVNL